MTPENEQLKALAEAATNEQQSIKWWDAISLENNDNMTTADAEFVAYASPERILALIAEKERLTQANLDLTTTLRLATKRRSEPDSGMEIMKL